MIDVISVLARLGQQSGPIFLFGAIGLTLACNLKNTSPKAYYLALKISSWATILSLGAGSIFLLTQMALVPQVNVSKLVVLEKLVLDSQFGIVWLTRMICLAITALCLILVLAKRRSKLSVKLLQLSWLNSFVAVSFSSFSGHSVAVEPWPETLIINIVHLVAASVWFGGLTVVLLILVLAKKQITSFVVAIETFKTFSKFALPSMVALLFSGLWVAYIQIETFPALFATNYGFLLCLKLILVTSVLFFAWKIRFQLLTRASYSENSKQKIFQWTKIDWLMAIILLTIAVALGQTIPGAHDEIKWWLPFRIAVEVALEQKWVPQLMIASAILIALGLLTFKKRFSQPKIITNIIGATFSLLGLSIGVISLSVEAYPDTYKTPSVPYEAISVAKGKELFQEHCVSCHGSSGHGDGPLATSLSLPPADLTEPHTNDHTAGDMFWWLTYGKPPGVMPGFKGILTEDDRWDLINYLRTLALGYQGRIIQTDVMPEQPWLGAIDFSYTDQFLRAGTLKDFREKDSVLLILFSYGESNNRMVEISEIYGDLKTAGAEVLGVPLNNSINTMLDISLPFPIAVEGASETAITYSLLRRTLGNADYDDSQPIPLHIEFLIDRFGYIRAKWVSGGGEFGADKSRLITLVQMLSNEEKILEPPEEHVH